MAHSMLRSPGSDPCVCMQCVPLATHVSDPFGVLAVQSSVLSAVLGRPHDGLLGPVAQQQGLPSNVQLTRVLRHCSAESGPASWHPLRDRAASLTL